MDLARVALAFDKVILRFCESSQSWPTCVLTTFMRDPVIRQGLPPRKSLAIGGGAQEKVACAWGGMNKSPSVVCATNFLATLARQALEYLCRP
jgi:hypothetical protein